MHRWQARDAGGVPRRTDEIEVVWRAYAQEFGANLHRTRIARGLSQEDVAYRSRLTRYTYQKYEKGESAPGRPANPTLRTVIALSQTLGVSVADLLPAAPDLRLR
ncbi:helix-turn-helix domain-containing protein [Microbacterium aquimaris]|uniref:Helix-turn-helix transcriptional regulator n=1 Tax=Microbacterium aquimaris TaxID=459816 RepID=A0ABU5N7Y0_9MICO|nr:helix-turn-helix transcriptional regulator [Microbacterium aquimaris]MDZ8162159.1 helix-turn-helix transcriptional regulator [Microbacterium aquimaris]